MPLCTWSYGFTVHIYLYSYCLSVTHQIYSLFKAPDESEPNFTASMEKFLSNSRSSIRRNLFRAIPRLDVHGRLNSGAQRQPGSDLTLDDYYDDRGRTQNLANHIPHLESSSTSWTSQTLRILDHERERIRLRNCPSIEYQRILTPENRISSTEPEDNLRQDEFMNLPSRIRPLRESRRALARRNYLSRPVLADETTPRLVPSMLDVEPSSIDMYFRDLSNATQWQPVTESFENNNNETFSRRVSNVYCSPNTLTIFYLASSVTHHAPQNSHS